MNDTTNVEPDGGDDVPGAGSSTDDDVPDGNPLAGQDADAELGLDAVFDILRNERRQHVLAYLAVGEDDTVKIGELAEHIAAIENDLPIDALTSQQRKRVYVALYQCHLPKMAHADVVTFDKDRGTVSVDSNLEQLRPYLDVETDDDHDRVEPPLRYVVLAGAGFLGYLAAVLVETGGEVVGGIVLTLGVLAFAVLRYAD